VADLYLPQSSVVQTMNFSLFRNIYYPSHFMLHCVHFVDAYMKRHDMSNRVRLIEKMMPRKVSSLANCMKLRIRIFFMQFVSFCFGKASHLMVAEDLGETFP